VQIVKVRLIRPRVKGVNAFAMLPLRGSAYHSFDHPVPRHDTLTANVHIMAHPAVLGKQGRPIRVTVGVADQFGEEYRLKRLVIGSRDPPAKRLSAAERMRNLRGALGRILSRKKESADALPPSPWTYEPGAEYLHTCEAVVAEERRSYAARGRRGGELGSLNIGLQSEPNLGWTKAGEMPQLLWKQGEGTTLSSPNMERLLKLRDSLGTEESDNLERFLLNQLRSDSQYADIAYFIVLALHRMGRLIDALTAARLRLVRDKVFGYSNVLGMLSALVSHEHAQLPDDLYQRIFDSLGDDASKEFRLKDKINLARLQRLDRSEA
jgi:hypothetical protein